MAVVVSQVNAGFIYIGSTGTKEIPLSQAIMSYQLNTQTNKYEISIRSTGGNFAWMSNVPLDTIEDANNNTYATINDWIVWWNSLDRGVSGGSVTLVDSQGSQLYPSGKPAKLTATFTRPANTTDYAIGDLIGEYAAAVKQKETITLTGTEGTLNISIPNVANRNVEFNTDLTTTASDFVTAYAADFLPTVVLTSSSEDLIFEAATAGVPFAEPVITAGTGDLDGTLVNTTANVTLSAIALTGVASAALGGGGMITGCRLIAPDEWSAADVEVYIFSEPPSALVGDNVAFVYSTIAGEEEQIITLTMSTVENASTSVWGQDNPFLPYQCSLTDNHLFALLKTNSAITAPTSEGEFKLIVDVTIQS